MSDDKKNTTGFMVEDSVPSNFLNYSGRIQENPLPLSISDSMVSGLDPNQKFKSFLSNHYFNERCQSIVTGAVIRNGERLETAILKKGDGTFHVIGYGEGIYSTLEEIANAINFRD